MSRLSGFNDSSNDDARTDSENAEFIEKLRISPSSSIPPLGKSAAGEKRQRTNLKRPPNEAAGVAERTREKQLELPRRFVLVLALPVIGLIVFVAYKNYSSPTESAAAGERAAAEQTSAERVSAERADTIQEFENIQSSLRSTVAGYFEATTVEKRLKFVRNPQQVGLLMKRHYASNPDELKGSELEDIKVVQSMHRKNTPTQSGDVIVALAMLSGGNTEPLVIEESEGAFAIDWEIQSRYNPMSSAELMLQRPSSPTRLRVYLRESTRYVKPFTADTHLAVELLYPDKLDAIDAYLMRGTRSARLVERSLQSHPLPPVIVDVSVPSEFEGRGLVIDAFVQAHWFVPN